MFYARHDIAIAGKILLISLHHRFGYLRPQVGIFAGAFRNTSPTRIPADIDHGRECPADTIRTGLGGGDPGAFLYFVHVPATTEPERYREHRFVTMNDVHAEDERDLQPAFLNGYSLNLLDLCFGFDVEQ